MTGTSKICQSSPTYKIQISKQVLFDVKVWFKVFIVSSFRWISDSSAPVLNGNVFNTLLKQIQKVITVSYFIREPSVPESELEKKWFDMCLSMQFYLHPLTTSALNSIVVDTYDLAFVTVLTSTYTRNINNLF